jgi:hypothetical protein
MKAFRLLVLISIVLLNNHLYGQLDLIDDNYILRSDVGLNYHLQVKNNDTPNSNLIKIFGLVRLGSTSVQYTSGIIDSSIVLIASGGADTFSGRLQYKGVNNLGQIDSAIITFKRQIIPPSVRPGDANNDNLVNHFDIYPIGLLFNRRGDVRHNLDTNIDFAVPKRISDWSFGVNNLNGKYADVDGNSIINQKDFERLKLNLGLSAGTYSPRLSDTNSLNTFKLDIKDTVILESKDSNKIKIPIRLIKSGNLPSYGLGFSASVSYLVSNTGQDSFYNKYQYIAPDNGSLWTGVPSSSHLFLEDKVSKRDHTNIAYCITNGFNGDLKDDIGVVEIIVDEILIGQADKGKFNRLHVRISEPSWIDNNYNTISVKPVSKYIYFRKATASIAKNENIEISVYPTMIKENFIIENQTQKLIEYTIFNALGQIVKRGIVNNRLETIYPIGWSNGIYYLKIHESGKVYRIIKE